MKKGINRTLTERGKRYGVFAEQAQISQEFKDIWRRHAKAKTTPLSVDQREALDMICAKIARILNGDPCYADSWLDIAGYAMLIADKLNGVSR